MRTDARDETHPGTPWPFTGRTAELDLVRRSVAAGRPGVAVTGPAGRGKTRLLTEALRGTGCARVTGTPGARGIAFAAFAHLLPDSVTLHRAVRLLSGVRLLFVDDAHLLDDASAALVHQLAVHGRTRLAVAATTDGEVPAAVSRLWSGELLPRLHLEPLPAPETAGLLTAATGAAPEPLTAARLHRLAHGDLRLLRDLHAAVLRHGPLDPVPGTRERAWRGPVPVTTAVRERVAPVLDRLRPREREALERLAFAEPLPLDADALGPLATESLEAHGLVRVDDRGAAHLAHPLHGAVLREGAGRLRARRFTGAPDRCGPALAAERAALLGRIARADVREPRAPVGEWLAGEGLPVPGGYAAVRARFARLGGRLREAASWAREGLRHDPADPSCRAELALATAQSGVIPPAVSAAAGSPAAPGDGGPGPAADGAPGAGEGAYGTETGGARPSAETGRTGPRAVPGPRPAPSVTAWAAAARGDLDGAARTAADGDPYDAVRLGVPERATGRLTGVFADHADALARADGPALDRVAGELERRGFLLFAAEAHAQAARAHRAPLAARTARARAAALARRCQGARTPALSAPALGELTARQRQVVTLAAAGLSNRQIAERLTLSVRTVGNHLYGAYARLGAGDRTALPCLVGVPEAQPA
ncbi:MULTISPECIES: helix-turn-helix transcriptional regulator [unclassified Streptomyces]|uniref:LuxR family transcriptional regulator AbsR2 n=1 Tax=unclassified Streptomyces TaxID=2593676 RepID=UPI00068C8A8B|nr:MULTISPECIES: helix-turn-helix transcriptional regulator [unclassified Streptomyces]